MHVLLLRGDIYILLWSRIETAEHLIADYFKSIPVNWKIKDRLFAIVLIVYLPNTENQVSQHEPSYGFKERKWETNSNVHP